MFPCLSQFAWGFFFISLMINTTTVPTIVNKAVLEQCWKCGRAACVDGLHYLYCKWYVLWLVLLYAWVSNVHSVSALFAWLSNVVQVVKLSVACVCVVVVVGFLGFFFLVITHVWIPVLFIGSAKEREKHAHMLRHNHIYMCIFSWAIEYWC